MKTKFTLKNIEVEAIKIGEITIEQDYSVSELISAVNGGKSFVKELLKDLPEMISDAKKVAEAMDIVREQERQENKVNHMICHIRNARSFETVEKVMDKARTDADLDDIAWSKLADECIRFIRKQK